ncbi:MAG: hypothetical protein IT384_18755 [Deltaproteobacteria bacterium]|nr:hypothetical protein [Deltaproteobacteria bacterium]
MLLPDLEESLPVGERVLLTQFQGVGTGAFLSLRDPRGTLLFAAFGSPLLPGETVAPWLPPGDFLSPLELEATETDCEPVELACSPTKNLFEIRQSLGLRALLGDEALVLPHRTSGRIGSFAIANEASLRLPHASCFSETPERWLSALIFSDR